MYLGYSRVSDKNIEIRGLRSGGVSETEEAKMNPLSMRDPQKELEFACFFHGA